MPAEFPSRICQIIAGKQWMSCRKYVEKRREYGELRGGRCRGVYRGRLRSGRATQARVYRRVGRENRREGAEGAGKKADSREPKLRECETGLGHGKRSGIGASRRSHMPDGAGTSREREGSERALRCARRSRGENRALRATRKREDAEQALGHMNRRALERGRRIGLKEQKESWVGAVSPF